MPVRGQAKIQRQPAKALAQRRGTDRADRSGLLQTPETAAALHRLQRMADSSEPVRAMRALQRAATQRGRVLAPVIQRAIIAHGPIDGLTADLDTSELDVSQAQIDAMWNSGKRDGLISLYAELVSAYSGDGSQNNNKTLQKRITNYVNKTASQDSFAGNSGMFEQLAFDAVNWAGDETGIVKTPGVGEQLPANPTARQTHALGVRGWQIGDIVDSISWSTLGAHLQGRLSQLDYITLGADILTRRDVQNGTNLQVTTLAPGKVAVALEALTRVRDEVRGGLDGLPKKEGVSYRAATTAPGVYGSRINVGNYIKDHSFWSTSGLRMGHRGSNFGDEGTTEVPKVYYIITGSNGVFLPRFTNTETGVREVLYKNETIFEVTKIMNYHDRTFFVHVEEIDPNNFHPLPATKNPWSGADNP